MGRDAVCFKPLSRRRFLGGLACALLPRASAFGALPVVVKTSGIATLLEPVRVRYDLPALAAAVLVSGVTAAQGAVGVRKYGTVIPVTVGDQFHLGSDTKAMTATLCGIQVERGKLAWDTALSHVFPEMAMNPAYRTVTLDHLLAHRSGFSSESWPHGKTSAQMYALPGTPREQRVSYVRAVLREAPVAPPGTKFIYSNRNYTVAGAIPERVTGVAWEALMRQELFAPLGMPSAGFGAMGTPGKIDQPWQHILVNGKHQAIEPGPTSDNPPVIGPAGIVHCAVGDWAKFVALHLAGNRERAAF